MVHIFLTSIQSIYTELKQIKIKNIIFYIDLIYYLATILISLLMSIFFGIAGKIDATIWSVYICAVNITNVYILYLKTKTINFENVLQEDNKLFMDKNDQMKINRKKIEFIIATLIIVIKIFGLIVLCLILAGSIVVGAGTIKYPSRGKFTEVHLNDSTGRTSKVHLLCSGPKNSSQPLILIEGDASHGLTDYLYIQELLTLQERRSCIWDKPGLGYSDYLYTDMKNYSLIYSNLIKSLNENPPYVFVGWGGGGQLIYEYASEHPEMVSSIVFLDVYPNGVEFKVEAALNNWTQSQLNDYKNKEFAQRESLLNLINSLGVPFGLMNMFVQLPKVKYSDFVYEIHWNFLTEKTWTTQAFLLPELKKQENVFESLKINENIPINLVASFKSDEQVINTTCVTKNYPSDSKECLREINSNRLYILEKENLVNLTRNGKIKRCTFNECNQAFLVGEGANFTVQAILSFTNRN